MGIISVEQADRLYWLGRYTERVYTTLRIFYRKFDAMIDEITDSYQSFCRMVDIPDIYGDKEVFLKCYPFDEENPDSILSNLNRAYDNAIVLRESIGSETLSYVQLALYEMHKAKISRSPLIELQRALDDLMAFWGTADDQIDLEQVRNIIKAGKRIERVDLYARLGMKREALVREVHRCIPRVERSGLAYAPERLSALKCLVEAPELNYDRIVREVEAVV